MALEEKRLLNCKEAARFLGITESALRKRMFLRQIKGMVRIGGSVYFDRKKLDLFIDSIEVPTSRGKKNDQT